MSRPVERRPDQLGHAGIDDDLATAPVAHVEDAGDQPAGSGHERPPGFDRQAGRPTIVRDGLERGRELAGESFRESAIGWSVGSTGNPPPRSTVSKVSIEPRHNAAIASGLADGVTPGVDGTELRPDVQVDSPRAERTVRPATRLDRLPDLGLGHAELAGAGPDGEPGVGLRRDVRVQPVQDIDAQPSLSGPTHREGERPASSGDSSAIQRSGEPSAAARAASRRSAGVLPTPSSVIRSFGTPARRASAHSPRETTFAPNPREATWAMTAGTSFALTEYCRMIGSGNAAVTAAQAASTVARSVTKSGVPYRRAATRSDSSIGVSVGDDKPDDGRGDGQDHGTDDGRNERIDGQQVRREIADRERVVDEIGQPKRSAAAARR